MKKILLLALFISIDVLAVDSSYTPSTHIVSIPRVKVYKTAADGNFIQLDESIAYSDVQLQLNPDGTWKILTIKTAEATLTGHWSGALKKPAGFMDFFLEGYIQFSLTQTRPFNFDGTGTYEKHCGQNCIPETDNISIKGSLDRLGGRLIRLEITFNNRVVNFVGDISNDYRLFSASSTDAESKLALSIRRED